MKLTEQRADDIKNTISRAASALSWLIFEAFIVLFIANTIWEYVKTWAW